MKHSTRIVVVLVWSLGLGLSGCSTVGSLGRHQVVPADPEADPASSAARSPSVPTRGMVELKASPEELKEALPQAMADLKMTYLRTRKNGLVYQIDGTTADDRSVTATIRPGVDRSRFSSRIGWFGDSVLSAALAERVGIRAGVLPPKPIPDEPPSQPDPNPFFSKSAVSDEDMYREMVEAPYRDRVVP